MFKLALIGRWLGWIGSSLWGSFWHAQRFHPRCEEKVPGTCEEIGFEKRGVGMMIGEYVTFVAG
jgi:hypothetical protein